MGCWGLEVGGSTVYLAVYIQQVNETLFQLDECYLPRICWLSLLLACPWFRPEVKE